MTMVKDALKTVTSWGMACIKRFTVWDMAALKLCLLSMGLAIGAGAAKKLRRWIPVLVLVTAGSWIYLLWRMMRQDAVRK